MNNIKEKRKWRMSTNVIFTICFLFVLLFLTYDIIITNVLAHRICKAESELKTFVLETVDSPESIYWEDNVYPGFNEKDRIRMIRSYLNGINLKTMALNAPDGRIYVFTAKETDWKESKAIHAREKPGNHMNAIEEEAQKIATSARIYSKNNMPQMNYSITFNPIELSEYEQRYLWSDEIIIKDQTVDKVIAYNRRLMRFFYRFLPDLAGGRYYMPKAICGASAYMGFGREVFIYQRTVKFPPAHSAINTDLLKIKGE